MIALQDQPDLFCATESQDNGENHRPRNKGPLLDQWMDTRVDPNEWGESILIRFGDLLHRVTGLTLEPCLAIALAALGGAAGGTHRGMARSGRIISPTLLFWLQAKPNFQPGTAVDLALFPLREQQARWQWGEIGDTEGLLTEKSAQARELEKLEMLLSKLNAQIRRSLDSESDWTEKPRREDKIPRDKLAKEAASLKERIEKTSGKLSQAQIQRRPVFVSDSDIATALTEPQAVSRDGSMFMTHSGSQVANFLEGLNVSKVTAIARRFEASWRGDVSWDVETEATHFEHPMVSCLWRASAEDLARVIGAPKLKKAGLARSIMVLDCEDSNEGPMNLALLSYQESERISKEWEKLLVEILQARLHNPNQVKLFRYGGASLEPLNVFIEEASRLCAELPPELASHAEMLPELAHKLLLIDEVLPGKAQPAELMKLARWIGARHLSAVSDATGKMHLQVSDQDLRKMLIKLLDRDGVNRRDLFRRYNCQDYDHLTLTLNVGVDRGLIQKRDNLLYATDVVKNAVGISPLLPI